MIRFLWNQYNAFDKSKSETLDGSTVAESGTIIQTINEY